jgi:hypothetical protein
MAIDRDRPRTTSTEGNWRPGDEFGRPDDYGQVEALPNTLRRMGMPRDVGEVEALRLNDPPLYEAFQDVVAALANDMLPSELVIMMVERMNPSIKREIVQKIAGLDESVLMTLKSQLELVDSCLRRVVNADGSAKESGAALGITPKDAINMSIKVTQVITRDLPKVYATDRIQRLEASMFEVIETLMTKEQQEAVLQRLEQLSMEAAKRKNA